MKKEYGIKFKSLYRSLYNLPLYNWMKMRKHNDFSYLIKDEKRHGIPLKPYAKIILHDLYLEILTEFFEEFGQSKSYSNEIKLIKKITLLNLEYAATDNKFLLNDIEVLNHKLEQIRIRNAEKDMGIDSDEEMRKLIGLVSSSLGKPVDTKRIMTLQFYTQVNVLKYQVN